MFRYVTDPSSVLPFICPRPGHSKSQARTAARMLILIFPFLTQFAASRGIHIIPYRTLQRYVTSIDLRSALTSHIAFKLSFGLTFALSSFAPL